MEIGYFWYFHIYSGLLFCDSLCLYAVNHLNANKERKVLVKFYFYHDMSYFALLWMFASVKSFSKVERGNQQKLERSSRKKPRNSSGISYVILPKKM